ncbi:hypothetical protein [Alienimonas californiensis]|uniref:Uncharacterized protein n=1 Tax=Alienimonas californiensis TaxID=2527989 RepID=A0A517P4M8_9PLAN|nr:hypothetical protein [Alienimonas californiensis]QDT14329.1 hypothetical protein CA12_04010 [Alienimonas californiensis]
MAKSSPKSSPSDSTRQRSPNYPSVGLPDAVTRATRLYEGVGTAGASPDSAAKLIGYSKNHGTARMTMSALKKFGLVEERSGRVVPAKLTVDLANFPPTHPRHGAALRTAALSPTIYRDVYTRYRPHGVLPPDDVLGPELVADSGFLPDKVEGFLADLRGSLVHAGLLRGNALAEAGEVAHGNAPELAAFDPSAPPVPRKGDVVRWTEASDEGEDDDEAEEQEGVVQGLSEDGVWAFVEGYGDGVPVADLTVVSPDPDEEDEDDDARPPGPAPHSPFAARKAPTRTEACALAEGDAVLTRPDDLSRESLEELQAWLDLVMKKLRRLSEAAE